MTYTIMGCAQPGVGVELSYFQSNLTRLARHRGRVLFLAIVAAIAIADALAKGHLQVRFFEAVFSGLCALFLSQT